jgi:large subunit ribosomal protein L24
MKIRKWDTVQVVSGKQNDRWTRGEVLKVLKDKNKVLIKWINIVTKHIKKSWTQPGQIVKVEKPIDASNVMLVCPFTDKPTRVWFVLVKEKDTSKKFRFSKIALKEKSWNAESFIIK